MATTAALQNNVRLRVFLILVIAIAIRTTRHISIQSIHKSTELLGVNYILYGVILVASLLPFKSTWVLALVASLAATFVGIIVISLGGISTFRCIGSLASETGNIVEMFFGTTGGSTFTTPSKNNQISQTLTSACVQGAPGSMLTLTLIGINALLNTFQSWTIYSILKSPSFVSSAAKRLRILFAWALPFAWLVNGVLISDSKWQPLAALHIVADPTIILLATSKENILLSIIIIALIVCDVLVYFLFAKVDIVKTAVLIQIGLTTMGLFMLFITNDKQSGSGDGGGAASTEEPDMDFEQDSKLRKRTSKIKHKSADILKF